MQHEPKRVDIGASIDGTGTFTERACSRTCFAGINLLGTHVRERTEELTNVGVKRGADAVHIGRPSHAKINHLRLPTGIHENVAWLEVSVNDSLLMTMRHRSADTTQQAHPLPNRNGTFLDILIDRLGIGNQFHHKKRSSGAAVSPCAKRVDLRNICMIQSRQHLCLKIKPLQERR